MHRYKDQEYALKWFAQEDEIRNISLSAKPDGWTEEHLEALDAEIKPIQALLAEFGVTALGFSQGLTGHLDKLRRRVEWPDGEEYERSRWAVGDHSAVRMDANTWQWLRPLLEELAEHRKREI